MEGKKTITLEFTDYVVTGTAYLTLWGGDKGSIPMKPYHINSLDENEIKKNANDNGFGCQSIDSIEVDIYENYEGYKVFLESRTIEI